MAAVPPRFSGAARRNLMNRKLFAALGAAGLVLACSSDPPSPAPAPEAPVTAETSMRNANLVLGRVP
jgi:hypothetical protein